MEGRRRACPAGTLPKREVDDDTTASVEPHEYDPPDQSAIDDAFSAGMQREVQKLERAWRGARAFVDLNAIDAEALVNGEEHPVAYFFREARERGLDAVPVVEMASDINYVSAAAEAGQVIRGAMLRLFFSELDDLDVNAIEERLAQVGLRSEDVDLLLDLEALRHPIARAVHTVLLELSALLRWRSVTVASGAFPQTLAPYPPGMHRLSRDDWHLWQRLSADTPVRLMYGDYATVCPEPGETIDPRLMNPSASVRYTLRNEWLVLRGSGLRTPGSGGFGQFVNHARALVEMSEYAGAAFSYGDRQILRIADGEAGPGNLTTWVTIAVSHHIEVVTSLLAG